MLWHSKHKHANLLFSSFFKKILPFFQSRNLLLGLIIGYCIVSSGKGMVFSIFTARDFANFLIKLAIFKFFGKF